MKLSVFDLIEKDILARPKRKPYEKKQKLVEYHVLEASPKGDMMKVQSRGTVIEWITVTEYDITHILDTPQAKQSNN